MGDGSPPEIKSAQPSRNEEPNRLSLNKIGLIFLGVALAVPFLVPALLWMSASPSAHSDFVKDLYGGQLMHDGISSKGYEKYSNGGEMLTESGLYSEAGQSRAPSHARNYKRSSSLLNSAYASLFPLEGSDEFNADPENEFKRTEEEPISTFSADVDTTSYSYVRRNIRNGFLPNQDAVRPEEMINYFDYNYPRPETMYQPFNAVVRVSDTPWNKERKLVQIGIKGYDMDRSERRFSNVVFLIDVSGSMSSDDRLPLVKKSIELLLPTLDPEDAVSIVTYADRAKVVLGPTLAGEKEKVLDKLHQLRADGGTGGAEGLELAYKVAEQSYDEDAVNRIILATDGDFNVGPTDNDVLQKFVESKRDKGIYLSVLGFGMGNYKDSRMKALANHGNGVAAYIDTLNEAKKVLVDEASSTLFPIANDVKLQVEFNPATVSEYRLIGYEKRLLRREDFNNDKVDAGDIGSGHTVTAIYEITPEESNAPAVDELRYSQKKEPRDGGDKDFVGDELAFLKIRYKLPGEMESKLLTMPVPVSDPIAVYSGQKRANAPSDSGPEAASSAQVPASELPSEELEGLQKEFDFATAVAGFAQLLKSGKHTGAFGFDNVLSLAEASKGSDEHGYRAEFIDLVRGAKRIADKKCWYADGGDGEVEKCEW